MVIAPTRSGKSEFLAVYKKTFAETLVISKADPKRLYNLRCSQLPYCPSSVIFNYGERGGYQAMDLRMAYYTGVGTEVHEIMQRFLTHSGRFLANYKCHECGTLHKLSHQYECCDFPTEYHELEIDIGTKNGRGGIQGHIDGVFKDSLNRIWIIDFKTCTLAGSTSKEKSPGDAYKRQVRAYAVLLKAQYKIEVFGVMLIFIPRDNPEKITVWEHEMTPKDFEIAKAEVKADKLLHKRTMKASTVEEVLELAETKCGNPYCKYCKLSKSQHLKLALKTVSKLPIMKD